MMVVPLRSCAMSIDNSSHVPRPAPLARPAKKIWSDAEAQPGSLAYGRIEWDQFDAEAAGESAALVDARRSRVNRPPSRHGY